MLKDEEPAGLVLPDAELKNELEMHERSVELLLDCGLVRALVVPKFRLPKGPRIGLVISISGLSASRNFVAVARWLRRLKY